MDTQSRDAIGPALGRVPSGLFIVTVRNGEEANAFLGSWVMQASFDPPTLSVAIKEGRPALALLEAGATFAINVIPEGDKALMGHFAKGFEPGTDPYEGIDVEHAPSGVEVLPNALSWVECRYTGSAQAGDHRVAIGEITAGKLNDESTKPAVHIRKSGFHY